MDRYKSITDSDLLFGVSCLLMIVIAWCFSHTIFYNGRDFFFGLLSGMLVIILFLIIIGINSIIK